MLTGIGLATDKQNGLLDRFRSLPMSRSALLAGRTLSDLVRNTFVLLLMLAVGLAAGFRFHHTTAAGVVGGFAVLLLFSYAWIPATIGMAVSSPEAAQSGGIIWVFPLVFASSGFAPVGTMPGWPQAFAKHQPVSVTIDASRALFQGGPVATPLLSSVAWSVGIITVFGPLAVRTYRRSTSK